MRAVLVVVCAVLLVMVPAGGAVAADESDLSVMDSLSRALAAWGEYAATGNLALLAPWFVEGGPQWSQLESEQPSMPLDGSSVPLRFSVGEIRPLESDESTSLVWVSVTVGRSGFEDRDLEWVVTLVHGEDRWKVWGVASGDAGAAAPPVSVVVEEPVPSTSTVPLVEDSAPPSSTVPEVTVAAVVSVEGGGSSGGVRLPALSAWMLVVVLFGVALVGYLAPRLDRGAR